MKSHMKGEEESTFVTDFVKLKKTSKCESGVGRSEKFQNLSDVIYGFSRTKPFSGGL